MTNEKWEQIKEVFDAAWQRTPDERARFLDEACGTDETMRREVESLLSSFDGAGSFMAKPIVGETPGSAIPRVTVMPGFQLGTYRIEERLGEGGMGIVYRALDTKLNRPAAVKFLSADLADTSARRRFQRETQTASSLNHPHILTVYDAGEFEGRQYLITEFVDGGTLKSWVYDGKRTWQEVLDLLLGVADGLAAAHQAGILHRDIKPENILVARKRNRPLSGVAGITQWPDTASTAHHDG